MTISFKLDISRITFKEIKFQKVSGARLLMTLISKWQEKAKSLTLELIQKEMEYNKIAESTDNVIQQLENDINSAQKEIKNKENQIQEKKDEILALESSIQMLSTNYDKISQKIQNEDQQFNAVSEALHRNFQSNEAIDEYLKSKDEEIVSKIPFEKLSQMNYIVGLLAKIISLQKNCQKKQKEIDERKQFYQKLEILNALQKKQSVLKNQWDAISAEIEKSAKEKEQYEKLKEQFALLQKQGKMEHNEREEQGKNQKQALIEERDSLLTKQRDLENQLNDIKSKFPKLVSDSQAEVDQIYEHITQQEKQIAELKEKIQIAKNAIDSRKNIGTMTDTIPQTTRPVASQTQKNQPILGIETESFEKALDLNLDFGTDDKSEIFSVLDGLLERAKEISLK